MDTSSSLMIAGVALLVVLAVGFSVWSLKQRLAVRKHWRAVAERTNGKFSWGVLGSPMLEFRTNGFDCRLLLVKYEHFPDRVIAHITVPSMPADFAAGALGASHAVGRAISGRGGSERASLDHVHSGWSLRGDDALALPRYAADPEFVSAMKGLAEVDQNAVLEWTLVKYGTEDLPMDDAALDGLLARGVAVAKALARLSG